jgi:hypothetical protein
MNNRGFFSKENIYGEFKEVFSSFKHESAAARRAAKLSLFVFFVSME